jgi:competence protein ComEC
MRNLAISAIIIIAISPHEVAGPSFQMSFAATAALIGAYAAWAERQGRSPAPAHTDAGLLRRTMGKAGSYVVALVTTSLIAGTATAVFGAYHFQRVSALGLAANLAAMPIVSVAVMPFALLGIILMPFGLDGWAFAVMGKGLAAMIAIAEWFSNLTPIDAVGAIPASAVVVATLALVAATLPTTWLRVTAVPIALVAIGLIVARSLPGALIAEDARLVAVRAGDGAMAVNRTRPNAFTTEDWQRALKAPVVRKPKTVAAADLASGATIAVESEFRCADQLCLSVTPGGAIVVFAGSAAAAQPYCETAALVVIDDATAENPCGQAGPAVITKRDLARRGSAAVNFEATGGSPRAAVTFAIDEPYRPWHTQRAFSREARGLPPYERKKPAKAADAAAPSPVSEPGAGLSPDQ